MSFVDPSTRLTEPQLDQEKRRALQRMQDAREGFKWKADCAVSHLYNTAHAAMLACRTEAEIAAVEEGLKGAVKILQEALDAAR